VISGVRKLVPNSGYDFHLLYWYRAGAKAGTDKLTAKEITVNENEN
jgi:hypothetical protein